jgi:phage terminase large subunit-like protein
MVFAREMIEELTKSINDIEYFAKNYIKVPHVDRGLINLELNEFQRQTIKDYKEKNIFAKIGNRIEGKTTIAAAILLHQAIFNEYRVSAVMAPTMMLSNQILDLIFEMYENLPDYFKHNLRITTRNKTKLEFENMCAIYSVGSNSMALRGRTISNLYLDECEFISSLGDILRDMIPCISVVNNSRIFGLTSTRTSDFFREYT